MILVTGSILARPETREALLALSLDHVRRSRTEPGCLSHLVAIDAEDTLRLHFIERWVDRAALDAHFAVAGSVAFVRAVAELAAARPTIEIHPIVA